MPQGSNFIDLTGQKICDWQVVKFIGNKNKNKQYKWLCVCKCGKSQSVDGSSLRRQSSKCCRRCADINKPSNHIKRRPKHPISLIYSKIKSGAKKRSIDFTITIDDLWEIYNNQNQKCALSGIELVIINSRKINNEFASCYNTASVDRIDSSKGYTKENIQFVHKDINLMKMDLEQDKFIDFCYQIGKYKKGLS